MRVQYWLKVVAAGITLSVLATVVLGAVGLAYLWLPERARFWVLLSAASSAVITGTSALVHIYLRTH